MSDISLREIPSDQPQSEAAVFEKKPKYRPPQYEVEKVQLSDNIRKFDLKVKNEVHTQNPYAFNTVSLKKPVATKPTPTASDLIAQPTYNAVGKFLGVDTVRDWNQYYDKVFNIVEWAKKSLGTDNLTKVMRWISEKSRRVPSVGNRRIDDLNLFAKLHRT